MAFRWCEPFELAPADYALKYSGGVSSGWREPARTGNGYRTQLVGNLTVTLDNQATWVQGIAVLWGAGASDLLVLLDAGTQQFALTVNANQTLSVKRGTTVIGTSTRAIRLGIWEYIELKVTINDTTGSYEVRVNGENWLSAANVDTKQTANASANAARLVTVGAGSTTYDDWYICDGTGADRNDFLGDVRVYRCLPDAAGTYAQWTPAASTNVSQVDEETQDGDTTYNASSTAAQKDSFSFANVPTGGTVLGAILTLTARKDDAGARTLRSLARIASTDYTGATQALSTSYAALTQVMADSPAGGQWTPAAINAAEFGYELVS